MDANTVTAICATLIAIMSLAVSVNETRAIRMHNRQSIRPLLRFEGTRKGGGWAGIRLTNTGLGPAIVTGTELTVDGKVLGPWEAHVLSPIRDTFPERPKFTSLRAGKSFAAGYTELIFALDDFDRTRDAEFWDLVSRRIRIEVRYESLYGGEDFRALCEGRFDVEPEPRSGADPEPPQ